MGKIEDLAAIYERHISAPWPQTVSGSQRVMIVVYEKDLERLLRARLGEFQNRTELAQKKWISLDCTKWFAEWMAAEEYRDSFFEAPEDLAIKLEGDFKPHVIARARTALRAADADTVVGLHGIAA